MKRILLVTVAVLVLASRTFAAERAALPLVRLPPELQRVLTDYEHAWIGHDAAALALLFAEDGFVLANGEQPVRGRDAIREAYAHSGGPLRLRALDYSTNGPTGYIIGAYSGNDEADAGKFVLALRKRKDGRWLIAADIDNSNRHARAPAQR